MTQPVDYATPAAARFYTPAARFDAARLAVALPVALLLAVVVGTAYALTLSGLNTVHFRVGAACAAAAAAGLLTAGMLRVSRVHHRGVAVLLGTLVGFVALWANWVAWVERLFAESAFRISALDLASSPRLLFDLMRHVNDVGTWRLRGHTYRGAALTLVWGVEALILVLGCTLVASHVGKPGLFCPACRKRCARLPGSLGRFDGSDTAEVATRLKAGDFDYLLELGSVRDEDDPEVALEILACPCGQTHVLNASRIAWEVNNQGGAGVRIRPLLEGLLLTPEQVQDVRSLKDRLPPAAAASADDDETAANEDASEAGR